jgi:hypothetical protein
MKILESFNLVSGQERKHVLMNIEHDLKEQRGRPFRDKIIKITGKM